MPNKSTRMKWSFPSEGSNPWYEAFNAMVSAMDASGYASREDRHLVMMEGGTVTFTATTGLVTWSSPIEILGAITGFRWSISAGSISLLDGEMLYVDLSRSPTKDTSVTLTKASKVPSSDEALFLAIRRNNRVYWRDGKVLQNGDSVELFQTTGIPVAGAGLTPLAINESTPDATYLVVGALEIDNADFATADFVALGNVSSISLDGDIQLYNLTAGSALATLNFTESAPTQKSSTGLNLAAGANIYEIRIRLTNGSTQNDLLFCRWAGLDL